MNRNRIACAFLLTGALMASAVFVPATRAQEAEGAANTQFVVTVKSKVSQPAPVLQQNNLTATLKNHPAEITSLVSARSGNAPLQVVFLFDDSARSYLSLQIPSLRKFFDSLPPSVEIAVAYMSNGRALMAQTLTTDHTLAGKALRLTTGIPGISASPYFCLSSLAKHWPSQYQPGTRRVVFMVTNGNDPYYHGGGLLDPYVDQAIQDSQKAGLTVYSIYFRDTGRSGAFRTLYGQNYLLKVSQQTGGESYANALSSPVSFDPYLRDFGIALKNQYVATLAAQGSGIQQLKLKSNVSGMKLAAPSAVYVGPRQ